MNYNKYSFTVGEFLNICTVDELANAPYDVPFLYTKRQKNQIDVVNRLKKELDRKEFEEMINDEDHPLTVQFWVKGRGKKTQTDFYQDQGGKIISAAGAFDVINKEELQPKYGVGDDHDATI